MTLNTNPTVAIAIVQDEPLPENAVVAEVVTVYAADAEVPQDCNVQDATPPAVVIPVTRTLAPVPPVVKFRISPTLYPVPAATGVEVTDWTKLLVDLTKPVAGIDSHPDMVVDKPFTQFVPQSISEPG